MAELEACPLCRTVLPGGSPTPGPARCPACGADLAPYLQLAQRADSYLALALELAARDDLAAAEELARRLPQLSGVDSARLAELTARLALARDELAQAEALLPACPPAVRETLAAELKQRRTAQLRARELFNRALALARQGTFASAAELLRQAAGHDPRSAAIWRLKLKTDLKSRYYVRCYLDLQALDRLGERPPQYAGLERLLPPMAAA